MEDVEKEIWNTVEKHLKSIFSRNSEAYEQTTSKDLSLYEWFVVPHRQDGLPFHLFMIDHSWGGTGAEFRYDLWEPRLQLYADTAIVCYTFTLTIAKDGSISHRTHNESRVLIRDEEGWKVVHVHKSPAWNAPYMGE